MSTTLSRWLRNYTFVLSVPIVLGLSACSGGGGGGDDSDGGGGNGDDGGGGNGTGANAGGEDGGNNGPVDPAKCGNGAIDPGEECDDRDRDSGDGCDELCQKEEGFNCTAPGVACEECGNDTIESSETCDDGNRTPGDGCDASCQKEGDAWACSVGGEPCELCGDGVDDPQELCDDGNLVGGDGCAADCRAIEENFSCPKGGGPCEECGDGEVALDEVCDDGNVMSNDGCTFNCKNVEAGWVCDPDGGDCTECGDKLIDPDLEECDDGNINPGDGCDASCQQEPGSTCLLLGQLCFVCGNGFIEPVSVDTKNTPSTLDDVYTLEECDDGNMVNGDGCDACVQDPDYDCPLPNFECNLCGDGLVTGLEVCDDGKQCTNGAPCDAATECTGIGDGTCATRASDGCASDCSEIDPFYSCEVEGEPCTRCGDGLLDFGEECDDGIDATFQQPIGGDGCSRTCQVEDGWFCSTNTDLTFEGCSLCGDGQLDLDEVCDDNNAVGGDGCSATCSTIEAGHNCFFPGFLCPACGNGVIEPGEQCDEGAGNKTAGCDLECQTVLPWVCFEQNTPCELCGDSVLGANYESCEDGNIASGDGCSSTCEIEPGYECTGATCVAAACGDGFRAGEEECDDGDELSGDGCSVTCDIERGFVCPSDGGECRATVCGDTVVEGEEECDDGNAATPGCDADCQLETGYKCPDPGVACAITVCGDGFVEGTEQCDDMNASAPGCDSNCQLEDEFACPTLDLACNGGTNAGKACTSELSCPGGDCSPRGDVCHGTTCNDGLVEGTEACDDGGALGVCRGGTNDGDSCDEAADCAGSGVCVDGCVACEVQPFYRCTNEVDEPSTCRPIIEFVAIRRFNVNNVSPAGLTYEPRTRSFIGYKSVDAQMPVELCLDGTLIEDGFKMVCVGGLDDGEVCDADGDCLSNECGEAIPGYQQGRVPVKTYRDGAYDPFTGHTLYLSSTGELTDIPLCDRYGIGCAVTGIPTRSPLAELVDYTEQLDGGANLQGLTVGEDGNLYVTHDPGGNVGPSIYVFKRRRLPSGQIYTPDCVATPEANCTSFELDRVTVASAAAPASFTTSGNDGDPLAGIFTVPGEEMIGTFNDPVDLSSYSGFDAPTGTALTSSEYFTFYGPIANGLAPRYGRSSLPGLLFDLGDIGTSYVNYAKSAETAATGGSFVVCPQNPSEDCQLFARVCETDADCAAVIPGTTCVTDPTVGRPYCASPGDARDDRTSVDAGSSGNVIDVLANDSLSESACLGPNKKVIAVTPTTRGGTVTITNGGANVTYNAPGDATLCGFIDTFEYTADLGGGALDTAEVRVVIACECGDGVKQGNEQCDLGNLNGAFPARCSTSCALNIVCGDTFIDPGEECDDGDEDSGDGCSALCTLESVCGDGVKEGVEACDDGNTVGGDACNSNCTLPKCGDGNTDIQRMEQCDDGLNNGALPATCSAICTVNSVCGNGVVEGAEQCDKGSSNGDPASGCTIACKVLSDCGNNVRENGEECDPTAPESQCGGNTCLDRCICENYCGDGRVGGIEECDDGDPDRNDGCTPDCKLEVCGDGVKQTNEQCDDGNSDPSDGCTNDCREVVVCGDGSLVEPEECDDGNNVSGDGCTSACRDEGIVCGDNQIDFPEQCDGGNAISGDGCSSSCRLENGTCGNGSVGSGEQCDDGNLVANDGCSPDCTFEGCGDGITAPGEQCDDGNRTLGDGCDAKCIFEVIIQ